MKYLLPVRSKLVPKLKNAQSLLKFGTFNILNTHILILMAKIFFTKHLPPVRPKLVQN